MKLPNLACSWSYY